MNDPEVMSLLTVTTVNLKDVEFGGHISLCTPCMLVVTLNK